MPAPEVHYYLLAGESLHALNRLIEYDRVKTTWRLDNLKEQALAKMGQAVPDKTTDTVTQARGLSADFGSAQIKAYQKTLGFHDLPVQVHGYADGTIYRAYGVLPKFLMNPGTSSMYFGLADLVRNPDEQPKERVAICLCYEDYKGNHFVPQGARELTMEEVYAYGDIEESLEHFREYDQGTEMPADFDPEKHLIVSLLPKKGFPISSATHNFILRQDAQKEIAAYDRDYQKWIMANQDFRRAFEDSFRSWLGGGVGGRLGIMVEDTRAPKDEIALELLMSRSQFEERQDFISSCCNILRVDERGHGQVIVIARPRRDDDNMSEIDRNMAILMREKLAQTPVEPEEPALCRTLPGSSIHVKLNFNAEIMGFPYMKIESPQDEDVRILAFRLPPNVHTVGPPNADCKILTQDEYVSLSGAEKYFDPKNLPTHAFRIEGKTLAEIRAYEIAYDDYRAKDKDFEQRVMAILRAKAPECKVDEYKLVEYKQTWRDFREVSFVMSEKDFNLAKDDLLEYFAEVHPVGPYDGMCNVKLKSRTDTEKGRALHEILEQVPYEPWFSGETVKSLGFLHNDGYSLMSKENLEGTEQKAVVYNFPSYITDVDAPEGTFAMTKEEFLHFAADSWDVRGGTVPPPRPAHIKGLPSSEGKFLDHAHGIRDSLKSDGFPLGHRSDSQWLRRPDR